MERTHRYDLLARLPDQDLITLAALVTDETGDEIIPVTPSTLGMIMARAREGARGEVFNLGEVLVTECQVRVGDHEGRSMLMGSRPRGAFAATTIDAASAANHPALSELDVQVAVLVAMQDTIDAIEGWNAHLLP